MWIQCNGGVREINVQARFGSFEVLYDRGAIANILSLRKVPRFEMDAPGGWFVISTRIGDLYFLPKPNGLYYFDMDNLQELNKALIKTQQDKIAAEAALIVETVRRTMKVTPKRKWNRPSASGA